MKQPKAGALSPREFIQVVLFLPLVLLTSSDAAILTANQVLFMADLSMNVETWGWLVGAGILVQGAFTFVFGYLSDKYPRKWLLLSGAGAWVVSIFVISASTSIGFLFAGRIIGSVGLGAVGPVVFSLLSDMFPSEKRSNSFAWWGIATLVGGLFGASLGLAFNQIPFESITGWSEMSAEAQMLYLKTTFPDLVGYWRYSYLLVGLLGLIFIALCLFVKEPKRGAKDAALRDALASEDLKYTYKIKRSDLKYIFTRKSNFWLIFNFLDVVVSGFFLANLLYFINKEMQFDFQGATSIGQLLVFLVPAVLLGLFGQFFFANRGDKKVQAGDPAGRVKVAIMGGILHIPFFVIAFCFTPNKAESTFFLGTVVVDEATFWVLMVVMGVILGIGLMWSFAIAPNWYASLIDVNLPEHRGTMIATASFLDTLGRAFGSIVGGMLIGAFVSQGNPFATANAIIWMTVIFGGVSGVMWVPIYFYCNKDFAHVKQVLEERAGRLAPG